MEKQIITFSANEQRLIKTGGIECYASNIVSYIEAHFDLGANWSGYDSVRAVWSNDNNMSVISTVLDADGVCVVPFEVLKTKGVVKVNLVGSISVPDVLTDRLTTFPCEAVKVTAKAKIDGSETTPITPSQFEQFVSMVISEVEKVTGMTAQAETLPAGSQATARYENGILYLGIPQGIQGERGETGQDGADGNGIASVVYNADYSLTLVFDNGERFTTPPIRGERGPAGADGRDGTDGRDGADGVTPSLSVGTVTTLPSTEDAYVTRTGTDENPVFNFGIPQGPKGDTGEVTMSQLSALLPTDTASGDIASFPDGTDLFPALSVKAEIEPIQDLHGYDKPWAGGAGANKWDEEWELGGLANATGVPFSASDRIRAKNFCACLPSTAYYFKAPTTYLSVFWYKSDMTYISYEGASNSVKTSPSEAYYFKIVLQSATTYGNNIAVNYPSTVTTYSPYSNICPISGRTEVVTSRCGKNVFDGTWLVGYYDIPSGAFVSSNSWRCYKWKVKPNTTYTISGVTLGGYTLEWKTDGTVRTWSTSLGASVTTSANAEYLGFYTQKANAESATNVLIEQGSTATAYEPYQGNTYTTTLGRTVYGGTLDVVSGELVVDRAMVDLGTLTWVYEQGRDLFETLLAPRAKSLFDAVCSNYPFVGSYSVLVDKSCGYIYGYHVAIKDSTYGTDASAFKTAMNGVQLCYELDTPQTYQLTPTEVDLLLGQNNLWTDCGSVEVTYKADVGLYIDKKLSSNGTRSLSMGLTKSATAEAETEAEPSKTEADTKTEEAETEEVKTEPSKTETDKTEKR